MPAKNTIKQYIEEGCYHIYNRGVEGREIFLDEQDYRVFLEYLKRYLVDYEKEGKERPSTTAHRKKMSLAGEVVLLAYCLMPNHVHLLVGQRSKDGITKLMQRVGTKYGMYFNRKYDRKGTLWEGVYKAVLVENGEQMMHVSRYIHLNPVKMTKKRYGLVETVTGSRPDEYPYSSYRKYIGKESAEWVHPESVLSLVGKMGYERFVLDYVGGEDAKLAGLTIDGSGGGVD